MDQLPNATAEIGALELACALIRCPSVTPAEGGALHLLEDRLSALGFDCHWLTFSAEGTEDVDNLFAKIGRGSSFCFAGHTDVVPEGDSEAWQHSPFDAVIRNGVLSGRGAVDMKGAIAAFAAAVSRFLRHRGDTFGGAISFLITGDEEGPAINGTVKVLDWLKQRGEVLDACLVGEPTSRLVLGDMMKIGRRGSLNASLTVHGTQGHVAYPHLADNPIPRLLTMLGRLENRTLDAGSDHFQKSNLEITDLGVGNDTTNVIPAAARARFNIRFNDIHAGEELIAWIRETCDSVGGPYELDARISGEAFLTPPGQLSDTVAGAVTAVTGRQPELSTGGGTSDARFIKNICPVVEFGLPSTTMHQVNEAASVADIEILTAIYEDILNRWFPSESKC
jgi:succinyl-diaminopimelate desuccinylase